MKLWGIFRFELSYQLRRPWPWLSLAVLVVFAFVSTRVAIVPVTLPQDFILNSPFIIAAVSVFSCQIWLLIAPAVAGEAAARDVHTGMHSLTYSSPVSKGEYLGGRFLAAFLLHALILLGVQAGSLLAAFGPGANANIVGPFRPAAYLAAYVFIGLTNAFIAATFQFAAALFSGRPIAGYVGSLGLFFLSYPVTFALYLGGLGQRGLLADPIGVMAIMNEMMSNWTIVEKNVRMFTLEGPMLWNRLLWIGISLVTLAFMYVRFQFAHHTTRSWWKRRVIPSGAPKARRRGIATVPVVGPAPLSGRSRFLASLGMTPRSRRISCRPSHSPVLRSG